MSVKKNKKMKEKDKEKERGDKPKHKSALWLLAPKGHPLYKLLVASMEKLTTELYVLVT